MYCNHCGAELPNGVKFCSQCGKTQADVPRSTVQSETQSTITPGITAWILSGISGVTLLTFFFTWATLPSMAQWIGLSTSQNLFGILRVLFLWGTEDEVPALIFIAFLLGIFVLITLILQIIGITNGIRVATGSQDGFGSSFLAAGISSLALSVLVLIGFGLSNAAVREEDVYITLFTTGAGLIFCLILSVLLVVLSNIFEKMIGKSVKTQTTMAITCPHCGTVYEKRTAATACPMCHRLPGDTVPIASPKVPVSRPTDTVTCPFCKRVYAKGTVYCDNCKAQIGSAEPAKKTAVYCRKCGSKLTTGDVFCAQCGTKC